LPGILNVALSFALFAGLFEGLGLLLFQRINWGDWGPMMHVAKPIIWISPLFDIALFWIVAVLIRLIALSLGKNDYLRAIVFAVLFLTAYDWLTLTARLAHWSGFLLALGMAAASLRWITSRERQFLNLCKRSAPVLITVWLLAFISIQGGTWLEARRAIAALPVTHPGSPNVLLIVVDTLRADHVSSYGYTRPTTPAIDNIAEQGVLFENAIAPSSWSLPSHASLVTGRYPFEHGMQNVEPMPWLGWGNSALNKLPTLGELLQKHGYRTAAFSANRVYFTSNVGLGRGFIHFEDYFYSVADSFVRTLYGREFARLYLSRSDKSLVRRTLRRMGFTSLLDRDTEGWEPNGGARGVRKRGQEVNRETLRWIDRTRSSQHPFFAFLNYMDAHDPYALPPNYSTPAWDKGTAIDRYDDGVAYADQCIGALLRSLEQRGLVNNTLVVITSDHGEELGEHGLHFHAQALYWEEIHVPLVIWYPGHVPAGARISVPVSETAIPATILDLLGDNGAVFRGPALTGLWSAQRPASWPTPVSELTQNDINPEKESLPNASQGAMQSLVTPELQLIVHQKFGYQLYNWNTDRTESHNLISMPEGEATAASLASQLRSVVRGSMP